MNSKKLILLVFVLLLIGIVSCSTMQERKGKNPKPFNAPASWEMNPYGNMLRN